MSSTIRYIQLLLILTLLSATSISYADVVIPNVLGLTLEEAKQVLKNKGLSVGAIQNQRTNRPVGTVIVQAPAANKHVSNGYPIRLVVAIPLVKPKTTQVPNLKGMSLPQAKAAIKAANLRLGTIRKRKIKMENVEVLSQSPKAGKKIITKSRVALTISDPIEITGPRVKVTLDKTHFKVGDSVLIRAKVSNADSSRSAEYGFSINGKTHYSKSPTYRYTFQKSGRYIITASFRYSRSSWHASLSKTIRVPSGGTTNTPSKPSTEKTSDSKDTTPKKENTDTKVPNIVGLSERSAKRAIRKADLRVGSIKEQEDKSGKKRILKQSPKADRHVKKGTKINLTISIPKSKPVENPWKKPHSIISPKSIKVTQGKKVTFYSRSSHDKSTDLAYSWTSKLGKRTTKKKMKIDTTQLKAGKYWIRLAIKDSKKFSDSSSALLIITAKPKKKEPQNTKIKQDRKEIPAKEIIDTKKNTDTELLEKRFKETVTLKNRETSSLTQDKTDIKTTSKQSLPSTTDKKATTNNAEIALSSETSMQKQETSITLEQNKVDIQKDNVQASYIENQQNSHTSGSSPESYLINKEESPFSLFLWIWILLILFIISALLLILWKYRQRDYVDTLNIDYQLQNDQGEQEIIMTSSPKKVLLNSIHFNSQIDKGKQSISLEKESDNDSRNKES